MTDLFIIRFRWSESHLVMPRIVGGILVILAAILLIQRAIRCKREGTPFVSLAGKRFFEAGYDKLKFWGFLALMPLYIHSLKAAGFLRASLVFIFLFNVLFAESIDFKALFQGKWGSAVNGKSLLASAVISAAASAGIWYLFGVVFNITLP